MLFFLANSCSVCSKSAFSELEINLNVLVVVILSFGFTSYFIVLRYANTKKTIATIISHHMFLFFFNFLPLSQEIKCFNLYDFYFFSLLVLYHYQNIFVNIYCILYKKSTTVNLLHIVLLL